MVMAPEKWARHLSDLLESHVKLLALAIAMSGRNPTRQFTS